MNLTENFSLEELCFSDTAVRLGIDNAPTDPTVLENLKRTAAGLERARMVLMQPININSGYRCEPLERVIAQKDYTAWLRRHGLHNNDGNWKTYFMRKSHPRGNAADITCRKFGIPAVVAEALGRRADFVRFDQMILEGVWLHLSFSDEPRGEMMIAEFNAAGEPSYKVVT